ncbi:uncharacterized protein N7446_010575 [Penicillium canescens]|uniref:PSP1 C-terminal domain-containing protein n=1 Tax=Penicillium canescens TaxID=5083 RepID=A0AAD6IBQ2_PENCN|nr:uncharacterized protein N7446_010575 [Penicillium canescens]KAJ6041540.1 hypothetical protein N7460_006930 [Penicillium canescens]KAJ6050466.1 hypothetical protein N7446_010575 [Penicillium canescens]KAJ6064771.1 hypothetical protein N7444_000424 [Penicillium canescens]
MAAPYGEQTSVTQSRIPSAPSAKAEKNHLSGRRSTSDPEALTSSDDGRDHAPPTQRITTPATKPERRASWLNDVSLAAEQKHSLLRGPVTSGVSSSTSSDQVPWTANTSVSRRPSNWSQSWRSSFPWGTDICNTEHGEETPPHLSEIMASQTMANLSPASGLLGDEMLNPITHTIPTESDVPGSVPLHLTPKTRRSQSSSVGPLSAFELHARRPSVLRVLRHDSASCSRNWVEDHGEESLNNSGGDLNRPADQARTIKQLARENALLRQEVTDQIFSLLRIRGSIPKEDLVVDDLGEFHDVQEYSNLGSNSKRPISEHSPDLGQQFSSFTPNRPYTFADMPMRRISISSIDSHASATTLSGLRDRNEGYGNTNNFSDLSVLPQTFYPCGQTSSDECPSDIPPSPSRYAISGADDRQPQLLSEARKNQLLYLVTFKCHRADIFYVQKDSDINVKAGDLVIVEADRGTDLGTVQHANVTIQKARDLKQRYAQEHYKRLMFLHQRQHEGPNLANTGMHIINGMDGVGTHAHGVQKTGANIKPKLIKRLAQYHEIEPLRNKAGNEVNAKRVCQHKVAEHRLNIQVLDAELQMDGKKLTFYYFADSYINFNSLVAELFKIYKTRIWMSAINPAALMMPPTAALQGPSRLSNPLYREDERYTDCRHLCGDSTYDGVRDAANTQPESTLFTAYNDPYEPLAQPSRRVAAANESFFHSLRSPITPWR